MDGSYPYSPGMVYVPPPPPTFWQAPQWNQYSTMPRETPVQTTPEVQQSPPWHRSQTNPAVKVDSWRSYRNDTTNLQSTTMNASELNAAAPAFQPIAHYRPYKQLRVSNGNAERQVVQDTRLDRATNQKTLKIRYTQPSGPIARRLRSANRHDPDQPLPSIEPEDTSLSTKASDAVQIVSNRYKAKSRSKTPRQRRTKSPEAPTATTEYSARAKLKPENLDVPKKLLVILDLNGTLLYRNRHSTSKKCYMRPGFTPFVQYLFDNHVVMVYTSATPPSAINMVNSFLHPTYRAKLAAIWARDKLDLTEDQYSSKVQVYKKLDKVWADAAIQKTAPAGTAWDQSNTVLIDDSKLKALAQPHNLLQVPEYDKSCDPDKAKNKENYAKRFKMQQDIVHQLQLKLDELKHQVDASRLIHKWQTGTIAVPRAPDQQLSAEETVDQGVSDTKQKQKADIADKARTHLPTPESIGDDEEHGEQEGGVIVAEHGSNVTQTEDAAYRSVSPIDESVFREILSGGEKS